MVEFYGQLVVVARCSTAQEALLVVICFPSQWLIPCFMLLPDATAPGRLLARRFLFRMCSPPDIKETRTSRGRDYQAVSVLSALLIDENRPLIVRSTATVTSGNTRFRAQWGKNHDGFGETCGSDDFAEYDAMIKSEPQNQRVRHFQGTGTLLSCPCTFTELSRESVVSRSSERIDCRLPVPAGDGACQRFTKRKHSMRRLAPAPASPGIRQSAEHRRSVGRLPPGTARFEHCF
jgi:hypothetical protein